MQKWTHTFKLLVVLFFLTACTRVELDREQSLIVAIPNAPVLLDPRLNSDAEGQKIGALLYDSLTAVNDKLEIVPLLAERWEEAEPLTWRFHLRHGVLFPNGQELTSKDVVCTWQFITDPKNASPVRSEFDKIAEILPEDDHTFTLRLKEPYAPLFILLKKGVVGCDGVSGTGPYRLVSSKPDRKIILEANPGYFLGAPRLKFLAFDVVKDDTTRVLKLLSHEIDLIQNAVPPLLISKVLKKKGLKILEAPGTTFAYVGLNLRDPVLKNIKVRQALALALDRKAIINLLWKGEAEEADSLLSPIHWAHAKHVREYHYNLEKAKKLLSETDFKNIRLTLKTSTIKDRIEIARMLAHQWAQIGVSVRVEPYEWGTLFKDIRNGNFQTFTSTWVGVVEPDLFYNILNSKQFPPEGSNRGFYVNPEIDVLTEEGRVTMEQNRRKPIYEKVQDIVAEDLPFIPLWYEKNVVIYYVYLKGVSLSPQPNYRNFMKIYR
ncbi:MAG: ABC transporter substrate-binding protein [Deltaproteobacteria bacterium]|nr:ABC transporter substrate-binding protein [Deltaproteobacteria bacterium]